MKLRQKVYTTGKPPRRRKRGFFLLEAVIAVILLLAMATILFRITVNSVRTRQWGIVQNLADSYLTYEIAYAAKVNFDQFNASGGPFPEFPDFDSEQVELGRLPGGIAITGTIYRSSFPDVDNNNPANNLLGMENWKLRSSLVYEFDGRTYVKSRTVTRSR